MTYADGKKLTTLWLNDGVDCAEAYKEVADISVDPIKYSAGSTAMTPVGLNKKATDFFSTPDNDDCPVTNC